LPYNKKYPDILIIPPVTNPVLKDQSVNFIPVGLLVLLGSLKKEYFRADIFRPCRILAESNDYKITANEILDLKPKTIGFSTWCHTYPVSILLAEEIKKNNPEIPVIFGGPQASILDKETLKKYYFVDFILKGEADKTLPDLLTCILRKQHINTLYQIPGLTFRDKSYPGKIITNSGSGYIKDLDELPFPIYEKMLDKNRIRIDAGRGCPFQCTYCTTNLFFSKSYRVKSVGRIISEMDYCKNKLTIYTFGLSHDMLTLNKKFIHNLCNRLSDHYQKINKRYTWTCSARTDCVTKEMLNEMWNSGCRAIFFGIESGSDRIQESVRKKLNIKDAYEKVNHATELGIHTIVSYMAGFPGETKKDLNDTLKSVLRMTLLGARPQMTLLSVLPGTPLYAQFVDQLKYDGISSGFTETFMTEPIIKMIKEDRRMFSSFYFLPNRRINRKSFVFIANLINYLDHFIPTLILIKEHIENDIANISLIDMIEDLMPNYIGNESISHPELFLLTDSIKNYMEYLYKKNGLPDFVWEVFQIDFTKAFMTTKYRQWQIIHSANEIDSDRSTKISEDGRLEILPFWKLTPASYYLYDFIRNPAVYKNNKKFRKGQYYYVVLPVSEKIANLVKISKTLADIIKNLAEMSVSDFIELCKLRFETKRIMRLLKQLKKLNMIEIRNED
jgi:radical SAM superfamily enzyme YgiQ (UPF0313 family)